MLLIDNITAGYGESQVLFGISLKVEAKEIVSILGSNGAGKSTILRVISGLIKSSSGSVKMDDLLLNGMAPYAIAAKGIAHVPEGRQLFNKQTVEENLLLGAHIVDKSRIKDSLERVYNLFPRLKERARQRAGTLSGGEQQMVAIGRGLMMQPRVLMLDEPSLGIAPKLVEEIFRTIELINHEGTTVLLVEQNVVQTLKIAHKAYVIQNGQVVISGTGQNLINNDVVRKSYLGI